jgi:hypothetical protein
VLNQLLQGLVADMNGKKTGQLTLTRGRSPSPAATHIFLSGDVDTGIPTGVQTITTEETSGGIDVFGSVWKF